MKQVELRGERGVMMICWLPASSRMQAGSRITISGDGYTELWTVEKIYTTQIEQQTLHKQQDWNNNV